MMRIKSNEKRRGDDLVNAINHVSLSIAFV